ncbi:ABC transporter ATP-binding protein [bacterium]|nr:ABC transporter ATP-binding protein [bacterium]
MALALTCEGAKVVFAGPEAALHALGPVSFRVEAGAFVCLVGPSGSGKSTLARAVAGLQPLTAGRVLLDDAPVTGPSPRVGMMFQQANLMPWRTVLDNIALPLELAGMPRAQRHAVARDILPMLDLSDFARAYPGELSGGMAQRVALGRILVQEPELLLLDEPFGALDAFTRERVSLDLLRVWSRHAQTVLMVTHDIQEAVFLADRVLVLSRRPGRIVADVTIPLPRPRRLEMVYTPEFTDLKRQVRQAIDQA